MKDSFRVIQIMNGEIEQDFYIYKCDLCGADIPENFPRHEDKGISYCPECAFLLEMITEEECKKMAFFCILRDFHLEIRNGEVVAVLGKKRSIRKRRKRNSPEYISWRFEVFERDKYKCRACGVVGGTLNAHHITPYSKSVELRLSVNNGITLCEECHKFWHRKNV